MLCEAVLVEDPGMCREDVAGRARVRNGKADLGAFAFMSGGSSSVGY